MDSKGKYKIDLLKVFKILFSAYPKKLTFHLRFQSLHLKLFFYLNLKFYIRYSKISTKTYKIMPVKHTLTKEIHKETKRGTTGCGTSLKDRPSQWVYTRNKITCEKIGCRN
ncbi:hypothetical protein SAMN05661096_00620 [Marivirga sericea]|uniref:Uncharacterized protein n=1 Tax=Marivirga sericea TaxID=1028 RepID=A0A1X7IH42_9BACT|nr:hypothetical protein SAMN05661096_00620 [Marivirga sericea]